MLIALTGGIASGKSTVARQFVHLGATEIDADILAREVVEPGTVGLRQVVDAFGSEVLNLDSSLNRAELARVAFASPVARKQLEGILHPLIQELAGKKISETKGVIVYTIPLLVETKSPLSFDHIITVSAPESLRIQRLMEHRGMSEQEARSRIASQSSDAQREAVADNVIDSNCSLSELQDRATGVFNEITND